MARVPLYEDPQYAPTIRAPRDDRERVAYEEVVAQATSFASELDVAVSSWEEQVKQNKDRNIAWATERASRLYADGNRRHANSTELAIWLQRVMFVTFMHATTDRYLRWEAESRAEALAREWPPPPPQPYGVSHEGAEALVAAWMKHLGAADASVTPFGHDGGIDVESSGCIAQVKNYASLVGVESIRELAGTAIVDGRRPLFFAANGYACGALDFAERARIAAFVYDAVRGKLSGANEAAREVIRLGLSKS